MDLSDSGKWRKSKVDSFIRRHLGVYDLGMTRYYEMCMWDNKGTLLPRYAILMDSSIVLTENPPKTVIHIIPMSTVHDISLIADRHDLIQKKNSAYICQHIRVMYEYTKGQPSPHATKKRPVTAGPTSESTHRRSSPSGNSVVTSKGRRTEDSWSMSELSDSNLSGNHDPYLSEASSSSSPSSMSESFLAAAPSVLAAFEPTVKHNGSNFKKSINGILDQNFLVGTSSFAQISEAHNRVHNGLLSFSSENLEHYRRPLSLSLKDLQAGPTRMKFETRHRYAGNQMNSREAMEALSKRRGLMISAEPRNEQDLLTNDGNNINVLTRGTRFGANELGERRTKAHNLNNKPLAHILDTPEIVHTRRQRQKKHANEGTRPILPTETPDPNEEEMRRNTLSGESQKQEQLGRKSKGRSRVATDQITNVLHLYFYQRDSEFLNELSLLWSRQQLKSTMEQDKILVMNRSLRAAEKILGRVAQDWCYWPGTDSVVPTHRNNGRLYNEIGFLDLLSKVAYLHKCLNRYDHLKYLCWKNVSIMSGLIRAIMECAGKLDVRISSPDVHQKPFMEKVAMYAILVDIFRSLYEACGVSWFKESRFSAANSDLSLEDGFDDGDNNTVWDYKLTIFDVTRKLLSIILSCPFVPIARQVPENDFHHTISNARGNVNSFFENSADVMNLVYTAHNASAALLFELLTIVNFLPTVIEKTLVTCDIQHMSLEWFLRLSVTQIIGVLWSSSRVPLSATQTMLLYRQAWNLRCLVRHDERILDFIRSNFSEEFQYYVQTDGIKSRIPDHYTIKPKVIDVCEELCGEIVGKPAIK